MPITVETSFGCLFTEILMTYAWFSHLHPSSENLVGIQITGWPRHTGDFSVFRIYADKNNQPADYSPDNVPYKPQYVAPISTQGYQEGSFCMTLGYPGSTERYLSSFGVQEMVEGMNQAMIDVRGVKQAIWKREMNKRQDIRIKYASKYDESTNYWKNSIGTNKAIKDLKVLEKKREMESNLKQWIQQASSADSLSIQLLSTLELNYKNRKQTLTPCQTHSHK